MFKKTIVGPFIILFAVAIIAGATAMPPSASLFPAEIDGWKPSEEDAVHTGNDLYKYINGGAELYISYGFKNVVSRTYSRPEEPDIIVDLFDMGNSNNAFGVFAHSREVIDDTIGQGSQHTTGLLLFWKDNFFVSILASPETDAAKKAALAVGAHIDKAIPNDGPLPGILDLLPKEALVEESIRYFHHHVWLNSHYFIADENILHIDDSTDAVLAKYGEGSARCILLVIDYPSAGHADEARADFLEFYLPELTDQSAIRLEDDTWAGCRQKDSTLLIVLDAPTQQAAGELLDSVEGRVKSRGSDR
jgi:hypothetical protein